MATKQSKRLRAALPDGTFAERRTDHDYTHIVALNAADGRWYVHNWCGSAELANRALADWLRRRHRGCVPGSYGNDPRILPVSDRKIGSGDWLPMVAP